MASNSKNLLSSKELATKCGAKEYHAAAYVDDQMLYDQRDHSDLMCHVRRQLASHLGNAIAKEARDLVVQRKDNVTYGGLFFPGAPGATEYRLKAFVFSEKEFDSFVENLLAAYGDQYAEAAMSTKKQNLKKALNVAVDLA
ncbi:hypothetical protein [Geobacter sp. SVR]|uniref:hypothetical protein n=1 Tax=Geobacter sp. SVR TaxID=2495594 RepID=UPI00143EF935|nr:hypothetical protein [Geobacter sp. SVR]BCS53328.1 hypothetical protein GSVR_16360 [Geobacter sp. SVR]GCF85546.1 hypothetical protein GSbR_21460 [Geobacter sp. SVR]